MARIWRAALMLCLASWSLAAFTNLEVSRNIDATSGVVRLELVLVVAGNGPEYHLIFNESEGGRVHSLRAETSRGALNVLRIEGRQTNASAGTLLLALDTSGENSQGFELRAVAILAGGALKPVPGRLRQAEPQVAELRFSSHFSSPYPTLSDVTHVRLASCNVLDYGPAAPPPASLDCNTAVYGPYAASTEAHSLALQFEHSSIPWLHASSATRELSVLHWASSVDVSEHYDVRNVRWGSECEC